MSRYIDGTRIVYYDNAAGNLTIPGQMNASTAALRNVAISSITGGFTTTGTIVAASLSTPVVQANVINASTINVSFTDVITTTDVRTDLLRASSANVSTLYGPYLSTSLAQVSTLSANTASVSSASILGARITNLSAATLRSGDVFANTATASTLTVSTLVGNFSITVSTTNAVDGNIQYLAGTNAAYTALSSVVMSTAAATVSSLGATNVAAQALQTADLAASTGAISSLSGSFASYQRIDTTALSTASMGASTVVAYNVSSALTEADRVAATGVSTHALSSATANVSSLVSNTVSSSQVRAGVGVVSSMSGTSAVFESTQTTALSAATASFSTAFTTILSSAQVFTSHLAAGALGTALLSSAQISSQQIVASTISTQKLRVDGAAFVDTGTVSSLTVSSISGNFTISVDSANFVNLTGTTATFQGFSSVGLSSAVASISSLTVASLVSTDAVNADVVRATGVSSTTLSTGVLQAAVGTISSVSGTLAVYESTNTTALSAASLAISSLVGGIATVAGFNTVSVSSATVAASSMQTGVLVVSTGISTVQLYADLVNASTIQTPTLRVTAVSGASAVISSVSTLHTRTSSLFAATGVVSSLTVSTLSGNFSLNLVNASADVGTFGSTNTNALSTAVANVSSIVATNVSTVGLQAGTAHVPVLGASSITASTISTTVLNASTILATLVNIVTISTTQLSTQTIVGDTVTTNATTTSSIAANTLSSGAISAATAGLTTIAGTTATYGTVNATTLSTGAISAATAGLTTIAGTTATYGTVNVTALSTSAISAATAGLTTIAGTTATYGTVNANTLSTGGISAATAGLTSIAGTTAAYGTVNTNALSSGAISAATAGLTTIAGTTATYGTVNVTTLSSGTISAATAGLTTIAGTTATYGTVNANTLSTGAISAATAGLTTIAGTTATYGTVNVTTLSTGVERATGLSSVTLSTSQALISTMSVNTLYVRESIISSLIVSSITGVAGVGAVVSTALVTASTVSSGVVFANALQMPDTAIAYIGTVSAPYAAIDVQDTNLLTVSTLNAANITINGFVGSTFTLSTGTIDAVSVTYSGRFSTLSATQISTNLINAGAGVFATNVGIGTSTPTQALTVAGQLQVGSWNSQAAMINLGFSSVTWNGSAYVTNANGRSGYILTDTSSNMEVRNESPGYLDLATHAGRSNAFIRILSTGNVGIGVAIPQRGLHVNNGILMNSPITFTSTRPALSTGYAAYELSPAGMDDGFLRLRAGGRAASGYASYIDLSAFNNNADMNTNIVFGAGGTERMRITSSGAIGIGTTTPRQLLDVNGAILATSLNTQSLSTSGISAATAGLTTIAGTTATYDTMNVTTLSSGVARIAALSTTTLVASSITAANEFLMNGVYFANSNRQTVQYFNYTHNSTMRIAIPVTKGTTFDTLYTKVQVVAGAGNSAETKTVEYEGTVVSYNSINTFSTVKFVGNNIASAFMNPIIRPSVDFSTSAQAGTLYIDVDAGSAWAASDTNIVRVRVESFAKNSVFSTGTLSVLSSVQTLVAPGYSTNAIQTFSGRMVIGSTNTAYTFETLGNARASTFDTLVVSSGVVRAVGLSSVGLSTSQALISTMSVNTLYVRESIISSLTVSSITGVAGVGAVVSTALVTASTVSSGVMFANTFSTPYANVEVEDVDLLTASTLVATNLTLANFTASTFVFSTGTMNAVSVTYNGTFSTLSATQISTNLINADAGVFTTNVGIGVNAPQRSLHVNNGILLTTPFGNTSTRPALSTGYSAYEIAAYPNLGYAGDDGFLRLRAGGHTNLARTTYIDLAGYYQNTDMNATIAFGTANVERMRITAAGNVGINTSTPDARFAIVSDSKVVDIQPSTDGNPAWMEFNNSSTADFRGLIGSGGGSFGNASTFIVATWTNHNVEMRTNATTRLTVHSTGSVGIGTVTPRQLLDVNGAILATSLSTQSLSTSGISAATAGLTTIAGTTATYDTVNVATLSSGVARIAALSTTTLVASSITAVNELVMTDFSFANSRRHTVQYFTYTHNSTMRIAIPVTKGATFDTLYTKVQVVAGAGNSGASKTTEYEGNTIVYNAQYVLSTVKFVGNSGDNPIITPSVDFSTSVTAGTLNIDVDAGSASSSGQTNVVRVRVESFSKVGTFGTGTLNTLSSVQTLVAPSYSTSAIHTFGGRMVIGSTNTAYTFETLGNARASTFDTLVVSSGVVRAVGLSSVSLSTSQALISTMSVNTLYVRESIISSLTVSSITGVAGVGAVVSTALVTASTVSSGVMFANTFSTPYANVEVEDVDLLTASTLVATNLTLANFTASTFVFSTGTMNAVSVTYNGTFSTLSATQISTNLINAGRVIASTLQASTLALIGTTPIGALADYDSLYVQHSTADVGMGVFVYSDASTLSARLAIGTQGGSTLTLPLEYYSSPTETSVTGNFTTLNVSTISTSGVFSPLVSTGALVVSTVSAGVMNIGLINVINVSNIQISTQTVYASSIGIGTSTPTQALTVAGQLQVGTWNSQAATLHLGFSSIRWNGSAYVTNANGRSGYILTDTASNMDVRNESPGYLFLATNNANSNAYIMVHSTGNVGIGMSTPQRGLHVNNGILMNSPITFTSTRPALSTGYAAYEISPVSAGLDDGFMRLRAGGRAGTTLASYIDLSAFNNNADMNANIVFGAGGTERMRITSNGAIGIATSTPTQALTVAGQLQVGTWNSQAATLNLGFSSVTWNGSAYVTNANGRSGYILTDTSSNMEVRNESPGYLDLTTHAGRSNAFIRIISTGQVGIGVAPPQSTYKLDVSGATRAIGSAYVTNGFSTGLLLQQDLGNNSYIRNQRSNSLYLGSGVSNTVEITQSAVNITGAPQIFNATGSIQSLINLGNAGGGSWRSAYINTDATSNMIINNQSAGYLDLITNNGNSSAYIRIASGGNVGIGTSDPKEKLHVHSAGNAICVTNSANAQDMRTVIGHGAGIGTIFAYNYTTLQALPLQVPFGNVAIGNITPSYKLDVVGSVNITSGSSYNVNGRNALNSSNIVFAHGNVAANGTLVKGYNVSTTRAAVGSYTVYFLSNAVDANYTVVGTNTSSRIFTANETSKSISSFTLFTIGGDYGNAADSSFNFMVI